MYELVSLAPDRELYFDEAAVYLIGEHARHNDLTLAALDWRPKLRIKLPFLLVAHLQSWLLNLLRSSPHQRASPFAICLRSKKVLG